jgi:hypothetical protein
VENPFKRLVMNPGHTTKTSAPISSILQSIHRLVSKTYLTPFIDLQPGLAASKNQQVELVFKAQL